MPRFAANLSMLYTEHGFLDRFAAAAADGFTAVEYLFPYAHERAELSQRLGDLGLQQVLFNAPPGQWDLGERGLACLPGRQAEFQRHLMLALEYAQALRCPRVHVMAGIAPAGAERAALRAVYLDNLAWAAHQGAGAGVDILIEPINTRDIPGYFLNRQDQAHAVVTELGLLWLTFGLLDGIRDAVQKARSADDASAGEIAWSEISRPYLAVVLGVSFALIVPGVAGRIWSAIVKSKPRKAKRASPVSADTPKA